MSTAKLATSKLAVDTGSTLSLFLFSFLQSGRGWGVGCLSTWPHLPAAGFSHAPGLQRHTTHTSSGGVRCLESIGLKPMHPLGVLQLFVAHFCLSACTDPSQRLSFMRTNIDWPLAVQHAAAAHQVAPLTSTTPSSAATTATAIAASAAAQAQPAMAARQPTSSGSLFAQRVQCTGKAAAVHMGDTGLC